ncbi:MAG TPA: tRNA (adenosine(37)-N6)-dimethylallyltransferase MiaA [Bacteroidales bacterium]|nr:tRNA (adenosine(37)-N6)-dimethylallyltransferase MiaA [Bacteroidales bacterium]
MPDKKEKPLLIVVTGPTATGKTRFAADLAYKLDGEIISADSRQVYRGMDLATGKDFTDYIVNGKHIPYHLVDIAEPGDEYNVFEFQKDFIRVFNDIISRGKTAVLYGGTGMYIEAVLKGYQLIKVPENAQLRKELEKENTENLVGKLTGFKTVHNVTDTSSRDRLIRAIEIQTYYQDHPEIVTDFPEFEAVIFGVHFERTTIRERITQRLQQRLDDGMPGEVKVLLEKGLTPDQLKFYGLEYRYLTQFVTGEITYDEMFRQLNTAIHQFAKRQMTWFRRMEKQGIKIHWIDGRLASSEKLQMALRIIDQINYSK